MVDHIFRLVPPQPPLFDARVCSSNNAHLLHVFVSLNFFRLLSSSPTTPPLAGLLCLLGHQQPHQLPPSLATATSAFTKVMLSCLAASLCPSVVLHHPPLSRPLASAISLGLKDIGDFPKHNPNPKLVYPTAGGWR